MDSFNFNNFSDLVTSHLKCSGHVDLSLTQGYIIMGKDVYIKPIMPLIYKLHLLNLNFSNPNFVST